MACDFIGWCALKPEAQAAWAQAVFSVIGIFIAIGLGIIQYRSALRIARASVRPRLNFSMTNAKGEVRLNLENNGLGPAIIKNVELYLDEKVRPSASEDEIRKCIDELNLRAFDGGIGAPARGQSIRAGAGEPVFAFKVPADLGLNTAAIGRQLGRIDFVVTYVSLYGDVDTCDTDLPSAPRTNIPGE